MYKGYSTGRTRSGGICGNKEGIAWQVLDEVKWLNRNTTPAANCILCITMYENYIKVMTPVSGAL